MVLCLLSQMHYLFAKLRLSLLIPLGPGDLLAHHAISMITYEYYVTQCKLALHVTSLIVLKCDNISHYRPRIFRWLLCCFVGSNQWLPYELLFKGIKVPFLNSLKGLFQFKGSALEHRVASTKQMWKTHRHICYHKSCTNH